MKMKKLLLLTTLLLLLFSSCQKQVAGKCGYVLDGGTITGCEYGQCVYKLPIKFDDGETAYISVDLGSWIKHNKGDRICF